MDPLLYNFLKYLDTISDRERTIVAVGGSALGILEVKSETKDVDLGVFTKDVDIMDIALAYTRKNKVRVDVFVDGWFQPMHFPDMLERALGVQSPFVNIKLYIMNPYDMILTKVCRWERKDINDIGALLEKVDCNSFEMDARYKFVLGNYTDPNRIENFKKHYKEFLGLFGYLLK